MQKSDFPNDYLMEGTTVPQEGKTTTVSKGKSTPKGTFNTEIDFSKMLGENGVTGAGNVDNQFVGNIGSKSGEYSK